MTLSTISALSPLDGRYAGRLAPLRPLLAHPGLGNVEADLAPHEFHRLGHAQQRQATDALDQTQAGRLQMGQRIAYVSDAGTPGVSDPGARLVAQAAHIESLQAEIVRLRAAVMVRDKCAMVPSSFEISRWWLCN